MSRVGKQLITIPAGVTVTVSGLQVSVKGPKGVLEQALHPLVSAQVSDAGVQVAIKNEHDRSQRALWGLFASLIKNMIIGVTEGFSKQLEINGVGMKAQASGRKVILNVGFSHPVEFALPDGIDAKVEGNVITVSGIDKQIVGEITAQIRKIKKPEPYKGKGIKYMTETIIRKAGKTAGSK